MTVNSNINNGGLHKFGMSNPISDGFSAFVPHYELKFFRVQIIDMF